MTLKGRRVGAAQADKFVSNTSQQQAAVFDGCFGAQQAFSLTTRATRSPVPSP